MGNCIMVPARCGGLCEGECGDKREPTTHRLPTTTYAVRDTKNEGPKAFALEWLEANARGARLVVRTGTVDGMALYEVFR